MTIDDVNTVDTVNTIDTVDTFDIVDMFDTFDIIHSIETIDSINSSTFIEKNGSTDMRRYGVRKAMFRFVVSYEIDTYEIKIKDCWLKLINK